MDDLSNMLVSLLQERNLTISCMESCTGGLLASTITNIEGSSNVLKVSLVTYSDEYKIKFGVNPAIIQDNTVYSTKVAQEMSKSVSHFANSSIGVGITGQIGNEGVNKVYTSIYYKNEFFDNELIVIRNTRQEKKKYIVSEIINQLIKILN